MFKILIEGESFLVRPYKEIVNEQNIQYIKVLQERNTAESEREAAINAMHTIANESVQTIQELEKLMLDQQQNKAARNLSRFMFPYRNNKDDLPN